ncbi:MAG: MerR family transcriptional regulator [Gemmatimonadaceae bacterium]
MMMIGQLAERAGVNIETIRYYERRGLLPEPVRTASGYRSYDPDAVARLRFIKRAQRLGFTLHEIEDLLALRVGNDASCEAIGRKTREKIALVRQKIRELRDMERSLTRLAAACDARRPTGECPILHALEVNGA